MSKLIKRTAQSAKTVAVIVPRDNRWHAAPSVVPSRFNSTSQPRRTSVVRPELNSVSEPKNLKR
jgi:hypothetical protein